MPLVHISCQKVLFNNVYLAYSLLTRVNIPLSVPHSFKCPSFISNLLRQALFTSKLHFPVNGLFFFFLIFKFVLHPLLFSLQFSSFYYVFFLFCSLLSPDFYYHFFPFGHTHFDISILFSVFILLLPSYLQFKVVRFLMCVLQFFWI